MQTFTYPDYHTLSRAAADLVGQYLQKKPDAVICLASGSTPLGLFRMLVEDVQQGKLNLTHCTFVGLDEWVGIDRTNSGSCRNMMDRDLFVPLDIPPQHIVFFEGMSADPQAECDKVNHYLSRAGGLDIMLVGIGRNGHIAMNEPGTSPDLYAHVSQLAEDTIQVGQKYFDQATPLSRGMTLGLKNFQEAWLPILMANGEHKTAIMTKTLHTSPTPDIPSTIIHTMPRAVVLLDAAAAGTSGR